MPSEQYDIFFTESNYSVPNDADGCEDFFTTINISTPIELFFGAQFVLEWDCTLFYIRDSWTQDTGYGGGLQPDWQWLSEHGRRRRGPRQLLS